MSAFALDFVLVVAANAAVATLVAALAWWCLRRDRPRLAHVLCVFALLKLITPPLVRIPVLATPAAPGPAELAAFLAFEPPALEASEVLAPQVAAADLACLALIVAALGTLAMLGLVLRRAVRFRRLIRFARPASAGLATRARALARQLQLGRCPDVLVVPAAISPMLCLLAGRVRILLPESLLQKAPPAQIDALLAHELAHALRRDHWVRALEVTVLSVTWWLPTTWWLRRTLRAAEERCCDAQALAVLPHAARTYADALLCTLDFLADARRAMPPIACGASAFHDMKKRLTGIMSDSRKKPLSKTVRAALLAGAAAVLPLAPTVAQQDSKETEAKMRAELQAAMDEVSQLRAELIELRASMKKGARVRDDERAVAEASRDPHRSSAARTELHQEAQRLRELAASSKHEGEHQAVAQHLAKLQDLLHVSARKADVERLHAALAESAKTHGEHDGDAVRRELADVSDRVSASVHEHVLDVLAKARKQVAHIDQDTLRQHVEQAVKQASEAARQAGFADERARGVHTQAEQAAQQARRRVADWADQEADRRVANRSHAQRDAAQTDEVQALRAEVQRLQERIDAMSERLREERKLR